MADVPNLPADAIAALSQKPSAPDLPADAIAALQSRPAPEKKASNLDNFTAAQKFAFDNQVGLGHLTKGEVMGVGRGIEQSGEGLANLALKLTGQQSLLDRLTAFEKQQDQEFSNKYGDDVDVKAGETVGNILPWLAGGEFFKIPGAVDSAATKLATKLGATKNLAPILGKGAVRAGATVGGGAAAGASAYDPDQDFMENTITGAELAIAIPAVAKILRTTPSKILATFGRAKPEDIEKAVNQTGTNNIIGKTVGWKWLAGQEMNVLTNTPLSGMASKFEDIADDLDEQGENLFRSLTGGKDPYESGERISDDMVDMDKQVSDIKKKGYAALDKAAEGIKFPLDDYFQTASDLKGKYSQVSDVSGLNPSKVVNALDDIIQRGGELEDLENMPIDTKEGAEKFMDEMENITKKQGATHMKGAPDLKTANLLRSLLGKMAKSAGMTGDLEGASIWGQLHNAVTRDINNVLKKPGMEPLKAAYDRMQKFYGDEYAPLKSANMERFKNGKADPDKIAQAFIPQGEYGPQQNGLLNRLLKAAPNSREDLLASYLGRAREYKEGEWVTNPRKLQHLLLALGPDRAAALIPEAGKQAATSSFLDSMARNSEAFGIRQNPWTGFQNIKNEQTEKLIKGTGGVLRNLFTGHPVVAAGQALGTVYGLPVGIALRGENLLPKVAAHKRARMGREKTRKLGLPARVAIAAAGKSKEDDS